MIFVITGNGKGKTTSAMGMLTRALGNGMKCAVLQFIKKDPSATGEYKTFSKLSVEWENWGEGFTWNNENLDSTALKCINGWESFVDKVQSSKYDMILLDEFTYVLENKLLDVENVLLFLKNLREKEDAPHVIITGRRASEDLIKLADTVSSIEEIKHHFNSNGFKSVKGIEF